MAGRSVRLRRIVLNSLVVSAGVLAGSFTTHAAEQESFKIGAPTSISGRYVAYGSQAKNGIEFAIETWRSVKGDTAGGRKIELLVRDTQSSNSVTVTVMNELIQAAKVDMIIGPDGSNVAAAAVPPWKKVADRPVWIMPAGSSSKIEQEVGKDPYFFHSYAWAYYYHVNNVNALKAVLGTKKKVAIVYSDGAYGRAHFNDARKYLKTAGFDVVAEELVREGSTDFNASLLKVRARKPDVLYLIVQTDDAVQMAKQIQVARLGIPYLIGQAQAQLPEWQKAVGEAQNCWTGVTTYLNGLTFPADKREPRLFPSAADFEAKWRARFKEEPKFLEAGYYASTMLALLAVEQTKSVDRDKLRAALAAMDYMTPMGRAKFEPSEISPHQAFSSMIVFQRQKKGSGFENVIFYPPEVATGKLQPCS